MSKLPTISLSQEDLTRLGLKGVSIIVERTLEGQGIDGAFTPYSTNTFAMPLGAITARARKALGENLQEFTTQKGTLWATIQGGYAAFKAAAYSQDAGTVNLSARGFMLSSLTVVNVDPEARKVTLGFTSSEAALLAWYHNEAGAGPSRTLRRFMGFTEEEKGELAGWAATRIIIST